MFDRASTPNSESDLPRRALESAGRRSTQQRLEVYRALLRADEHPTAEQIHTRVRQVIPRIGLATVYNALDALVACGLAAKLSVPGGSARFDARRDDHYHLRCTRSGRVEDLPTPCDHDLLAKLDPALPEYLKRVGFEPTGYRLELVGHFRPTASDSVAEEDAG